MSREFLLGIKLDAIILRHSEYLLFYGHKTSTDGSVTASCTQIILTANLAKFTQNPTFAEWLVATAPKVLVEASLWSRILGIGMAQANPKALNPSQWKGQNLFGFTFVLVRRSLLDI